MLFVGRHPTKSRLTPQLLVIFESMEHTIKLKKDEVEDEALTLLAYFERRKQKIDHECGGMGICGTCRVEVLETPVELPPLNEFEVNRLKDFACSDKERLSCQIPPVEGMRVKIPKTR